MRFCNHRFTELLNLEKTFEIKSNCQPSTATFTSKPFCEFLTEEHIVGLLGFGKFPGCVFCPLWSLGQGCHWGGVALAVSPLQRITRLIQEHANKTWFSSLSYQSSVQGFHLSVGSGIFSNLSPHGREMEHMDNVHRSCLWEVLDTSSAPGTGSCFFLPCAG